MIRWSGIAGAILGALLVAGCVSDSMDEGFGSTVPPRYTVGDSFTFDNPQETWTVVSIEGDRAYWRSNRGDQQVTGHDPLMPALEWQFTGQGGGQRAFTDIKGSLYPLGKGDLLTYTSNVESWTIKDGRRDKPQKWQYNWSCNVGGKETMEVPAGTFATYRIVCGRYKPGELEFFYAPAIGYFVVMRIDDPTNEGTVVRNLLSFRRVALGGAEVIIAPPPEPLPPPIPLPPPPPPPEPVKLPPPPPTGPAAGSGPRVVLGLFASDENAARAWSVFSKGNGDLLGNLKPEISPSGRYIRVATERLENLATAKELCGKLKARGLECVVTNK